MITPWRVSSNQDNNYKTNVPINATLIGAIATSIFATILPIYRFIVSDTLFKVVFVLWFIASAVQMPLVLAFTIKHHKNTSKINPVVPRTLQFHENEDDCDDCDNGNNVNNEANDELTENDEHPKVTHVEVYNHVESTDNADENSDYPDENGGADDNCECLELAVEQIKLTEIGEAFSQLLPGEVCHM